MRKRVAQSRKKCRGEAARFSFANKVQLFADCVSIVLILASAIGTVFLLVKSSMPGVYLRVAFIDSVAEMSVVKGGKGGEIGGAAMTRIASQIVAQLFAYGFVLFFGAIKLLLSSFTTTNDVIVEKRVVCEGRTFSRPLKSIGKFSPSFSVNAIRLLS